MWTVGTSTGELLSIDGIAFALNGNKYIVDGLSAMITIVSTSGAVFDRWNPDDVPRGLMVRPSDIAIGSSGDVYIASNELYLVHHFNLSSDYLGNWSTYVSVLGHSWIPRPRFESTVDSAGNVYVETNSGLPKYTSTGVLLDSWTKSELGGIMSITYIAVDSLDNFYVSDAGADHIKKYSSTGTLLAMWAPEGSNDGELDNPGAIRLIRMIDCSYTTPLLDQSPSSATHYLASHS